MAYVDGFVVPVPSAKRETYRELAAKVAPIFIDNGAERVVECWGDDVPKGKHTDFWGAVKCEPGEVVVFSWIVWPSKAVRDAAHPKVMNDPRMQASDMSSIFDGKRMIVGGFDLMLDTGSKSND